MRDEKFLFDENVDLRLLVLNHYADQLHHFLVVTQTSVKIRKNI